MVVAIATLAAVGIVVADLAGLWLLRSYLTGRVDQQLVASAQAFDRPPGNREPDLPPPRPKFAQNLSPDLRIYLYAPDGTLVRTSGDTSSDSSPDLGSFGTLSARADGNPYTVAGHSGDSWRVIVAPRPGDTGLAVIAVSLRQVDATAARLTGIDVAVTVLVLLLLGLAAASVVRLGLAPLTHMEETADQIAEGDLSRRVEDVDPHTEAGRLGIALNAMLGQIEAALADRTASEQRLRRFLADASHELRTPLTSIQGFAELYRRGGAQPGAELDEAMGRIESEAARMAMLVADLLLLARLDQERPLDLEPVDLLALAADAVRDAHARVPERFILLAPAGEPTPSTVDGDEARLRQVVTNLIANALQHAPAPATITVSVRNAPAEPTGDAVAVAGTGPAPGSPAAVLEVTDTGPGLPAEYAVHVFERLFRADASRQRAVAGGAGLGLSIVAAIVAAHGGRVELRTEPGCGAAFRVVLPALDLAALDDAALDDAALDDDALDDDEHQDDEHHDGAASEPAESAMSYAASRRTAG
jgi:two-component system OmpR family sensor kinase